MLKQTKLNEPLKLHSYKIDSSQIQSKLNQLDNLKVQMQRVLSRHKSSQNLWVKEIENLRKENQKLKKDINSLQFTKKSQSMLIDQLQKRLQQSQNQLFNSHLQLENEVKHRESLIAQYQSKIMEENSKMIDSIGQYQNHIKSEPKDVQVYEYKFQTPSKQNIYSQNSISGSETSIPSEARKIKKIKKVDTEPSKEIKKSVELKEKYKINNVILEKEQDSNLTDEDIYLEMIRVLYRQLTKIDLKSKDLFKIPAIDSFSQVKNPTINDIQRLLSNYPFQIREQHKVKMIYNFIEKQLERRGHQRTGMEIVQSIMASLEQIQGERQLSLASGSSSAFFSDSEMMSSHLGSIILRRVSKPHIGTAAEYCQDVSRGTIQEEESMSQRSNCI